jgi:hypothetical protein
MAIFQHASNHFAVGETCRKFYGISCEVSSFKLRLSANQTKYTTSFVMAKDEVDDEAIMSSMLASERKIGFLEVLPGVADKSKDAKPRNDRLRPIIERFGSDVKRFEAKDVPLPWDFISLMNKMPSLEKISLINIKSTDNEGWRKHRLNLHLLKDLTTSNVPNNFLNIFNHLPDDILHKVDLGLKKDSGTFTNGFDDTKYCTDCRGFIEKVDHRRNARFDRNRSQTSPECVCRTGTHYFLQNQTNIKEVSVHSTMLCKINWKQLKLSSLAINGWTTIGQVIKGQDQLITLSANKTINLDDFLLICSDLKSLKSLDIWTDDILPSNYEKISNLTNLKKARIFLSLSETPKMQFIKSSTLIDLEINCFNATPQPEAIAQIGSNCPNLKKFKLSAHVSFNILNTIIEYFLSLESLDLIFDYRSTFMYQVGLQHEHLKKLFIQSAYSDCQQLPLLLQNCKKLEEFSTTLTLNASFIRNLLVIRPNLNSLSLTTPYTDYTTRKVTQELIAVLKEYGSNLNQFQYNMLRFEDEITTQTLKKEFIDQFTVIQFEGADLTGCKEWKMRKYCE